MYLGKKRLVTFILCSVAAVAAAQGGSGNVALNKVTWQSSMGRGGVSERAVDGNKASNWESNSCTHTHPDATELPVWGVDLGVELDVAYVEVTNRVSSWKLSNFIVAVTNIAFPTTSTVITTNAADRCGQYPGYPVNGTVGRVLCLPSPIRGRYVYITLPTVQHLMLCEVEVFTAPPFAYQPTGIGGCGRYYTRVPLGTVAYILTVKDTKNKKPGGCFVQCSQDLECLGFDADQSGAVDEHLCRLLMNP